MGMKNDLRTMLQKIKLGTYDSPKQLVYLLCRYALLNVCIAVSTALEFKLTDDLNYLAFEDALNSLSVWDHTVPLSIDNIKKMLSY